MVSKHGYERKQKATKDMKEEWNLGKKVLGVILGSRKGKWEKKDYKSEFC